MVLLEMRFYTTQRVKRACGTVSRDRAKPGWCTGGAILARGGPGGRGPGGCDGSDWCDGLGVDQSQARHESHVSQLWA